MSASIEHGLDLPPEILARDLTLRRMTRDDIDSIREIYVQARWEEMKQATHWSEEERRSFLLAQADLQHLSYTTQIADAYFGILECRGEPTGRLYLRRIGADELRVVDIALMPKWRQQGLGAALLRSVIRAGEREGRKVSIHVEKNNPARHLYDRLGFALAEDRGVYDFLIWQGERKVPAPVNM